MNADIPADIKQKYLTILAEHGLRVANRWAYTKLGKRGGTPDFYRMYGAELVLPIDERAKTSLAAEFDPTGYFRFYDVPADIEEFTRHPEPGSPEAKRLMEALKKRGDAC